MTATFNPGQAEVPYVAEVQYKPAVAPTVTLTLSLPEAQLVRALLGHIIGGSNAAVYYQLNDLLQEYDRAGVISFMRSDLPAIDAGKAKRRH